MNIWHSWSYYLKRTFSKWSTWLILLIHLAFFGLVILSAQPLYNPPIINNTNDFFAGIFYYPIGFPLLAWTLVFSPISWLFWGWIDDIAKKTQKDGTDLFFLTTEIPTSRKQIIWGKIVFLTSSLFSLHLLAFATPLALMLWKMNCFANFTGLQTFSFLACNFLVIPLFFFAPLIIFLTSLASLKSVWYTILKWLGRLSIIILMLLAFLIGWALYKGGGVGEKIIKWGEECFDWLKQNYLLMTLTIIGVVICLAIFTLFLAYKKFQEEDLS